MEKTWRCTVCGYLHKGDSPPEICPVCGVDSSKFELVSEAESAEDAQPATKIDALRAQALTFFRPACGCGAFSQCFAADLLSVSVASYRQWQRVFRNDDFLSAVRGIFVGPGHLCHRSG